MTALNIGIAGAGLLGRLAAWTLASQGHRVQVFDPAPGPAPLHDGHGAAGFTAAGMLSPLAELDAAEADVAALGWTSITRWSQITQALSQAGSQAGSQGLDPASDHSPSFSQQGSLMVAHGSDLGAAHRVISRLHQAIAEAGVRWPHPQPQVLTPAQLSELEPALHSSLGSLNAWLLPGEGHIDTVQTMQGLHDAAPTVQWHWLHTVTTVSPHQLRHRATRGASNPIESTSEFDWVLDVRGVGARPQANVRGVRGEVVWLHAPGVRLQRPVRLLHPRHSVYMVPRPGDVILVGASELESEDRSPVSLRSAVELMAAAHSVVPELAEARIIRLDANLRPALPDNRPSSQVEPGLIRINGLYRHGWLLAPALLDQALQQAHLT